MIDQEPLYRLCLGALAGIILGLPAELLDRPGGIRTHMLVTVGATLFCVTGANAAGDHDVLRVIQGVASGIGFVGAATVLKGEGGVVGIATAASIFNAGAVGCETGLGHPVLAIVLAIAVATLNIVVYKAEGKLRYLRERIQRNRAGEVAEGEEPG